ncbi:2-amino-4-hydroxy-6-hydroxymethyldihydropteridine diphosphokinase [Candidatus Bipolaricaulota bacterium]|nr:2-amino-4-hydroxy-6-hydroxymethyldihydropteridine diphosphokinase [Candidatus Bipolaricaulota bacterium]
MVKAYVGLGSNLGNRRKNIENSIGLLTLMEGIKLGKQASLYETEPVGPIQPWFINTAIKIETSHPPGVLLAKCKEVESRIGRVDSIEWGPRLVDLDLLLIEDQVIEEEGIKVPHPQLAQRRFVLLPLLELEPDLVHPKLDVPLKDILTKTEEVKKVIKLQ